MKDFWHVLKTRRSIREFKNKEIPRRYIKRLIEAASFAPSGSNKQNWHFIVVKDRDTMRRMKEVIDVRIEEFSRLVGDRERKVLYQHSEYYTFFANAPVVIAVVMKPYLSYAGELLKRYKPEVKYTSTAGVQSVAAAVENLLLSARALGLGSCWMTGPLIAKDDLEDILKVKSPDELLALIPVGFPKRIPYQPERMPVDKIMTVI